jgi:hypothetical protein
MRIGQNLRCCFLYLNHYTKYFVPEIYNIYNFDPDSIFIILLNFGREIL